MKRFSRWRILYWLLITAGPLHSHAQVKENIPLKMLRVSEDNDFINIAGYSTDKAYTNGTKIDYFYTKPERPRWVIDRLLPTAGSNSNNIFSWNITELMFTPKDLGATNYQPNDYPYSTALYISHGLYSYNAAKRWSVQSELIAGIRGPAALGEQTQKFIHRLIHFQRPRGWDNQLQNKVILNTRFAAEKELYGYENKLDIIGGASVEAGSFSNALTFYPVIRIGKMNDYFDGLINQYTSAGKNPRGKKRNIQLYLLFKPGVTLYATNGILQTGNQEFNADGKNEKLGPIKHIVWFFNGGAVLSINHMGISFNQNFTSALMQHLYAHGIGNVSVYYRL